jgi:hypothetical protein
MATQLFDKVFSTEFVKISRKRVTGRLADQWGCCNYCVKIGYNKRLLKIENLHVSCGYTDIWSVCGSVGLLLLVVVEVRKWSVDPLSNPKPRR